MPSLQIPPKLFGCGIGGASIILERVPEIFQPVHTLAGLFERL
jgi:hypothetical protein